MSVLPAGVVLERVLEDLGPFQRQNLAAMAYTGGVVGAHTLIMVFNTDLDHPERNMISDFGLDHNGRSWLIEFTSTAFFAGWLVGAGVIGALADSRGRKTGLLVSIVGSVVCMMAAALAPNVELYIVARFLDGLFVGGISLSGFVHATEFLSPAHGALASTLLNSTFAVFAALLVVVVYYIENWRIVHAIVALLGALFLPYFGVLQESARWLVCQGRIEDGFDVLARVSRANGTPWPLQVSVDDPLLPDPTAPQLADETLPAEGRPTPGLPTKDGAAVVAPALQADNSETSALLLAAEAPPVAGGDGSETGSPPTRRVKGGSLLSDEDRISQVGAKERTLAKDVYNLFFTSRPVSLAALSVIYVWFAVSFTYYGISLNSGNVGSIYLVSALNSVVELPAYFGGQYCISRYGRKMFLALAFLFTSFCCLLFIFISGPLQTAIAIMGKFFATSAFGVAFVIAAEVMPTSLRNTGVGIASQGARIGGMLSPQVVALDRVFDGFAMMAWAVTAGLAAILIFFFVPETRGQPLPDSVEELARRLRRR